MIEVVGKDGVIYHLDVECPASFVDRAIPNASPAEQRVLEMLKQLPGLAREPRIIRAR